MFCYFILLVCTRLIRLTLTRLSILRKSDDIRMLITFVVSVSKNQHNGCKYSDTKTDDHLHICSFLTNELSSKSLCCINLIMECCKREYISDTNTYLALVHSVLLWCHALHTSWANQISAHHSVLRYPHPPSVVSLRTSTQQNTSFPLPRGHGDRWSPALLQTQ